MMTAYNPADENILKGGDFLPGASRPGYLACWDDGSSGAATITTSMEDGGAGHQHSNGGRPVGGAVPATVTFPCDNVWHPLVTINYPDVAGIMTLNCGPDCSGDRVYVRVSGLVPLPASPYIVQVGLSALTELLMQHAAVPHDHPDNHWGKPELISKTLQLAETFYKQRNQKLYVNDMSLPWGGVLDFTDKWAPPHQTHRDGRHVDIRKQNMSGDDVRAFRNIAENIFGVGHVCVDGGPTVGAWHLSIETTCTDQPLNSFGIRPEDVNPKFLRQAETP
jgi:penicillin-insensitive murein endopeptidase